jgi:hypothetical protein
VLADLDSAPVEDGLRATLRVLGKLTREGKADPEDMREVLSRVSHLTSITGAGFVWL